MKNLPLSALALAIAAGVSAPALAQGEPSRLEPYVGVIGGVHDFDNSDVYKGAPPFRGSGALAEGVAGVNYNLGRFVVGAEGSVAKGVSGDLDWEYGAAGRVGAKVGKDSLFFAKVGYQWTEFAHPANGDQAYDGVTYGFGTELSLADMGSADSSNIRLRGQVDTRGNFHSFRPMLGVVAKF